MISALLSDATGQSDQQCTYTSSAIDKPVLIHSIQQLPADSNCDKKRSEGILPSDVRQKQGMSRADFDFVCADHSFSFSIEFCCNERSTIPRSEATSRRKAYMGIIMFLRIFHVHGQFQVPN
jgi:hypothetical protein